MRGGRPIKRDSPRGPQPHRSYLVGLDEREGDLGCHFGGHAAFGVDPAHVRRRSTLPSPYCVPSRRISASPTRRLVPTQ
jgi:hypothetical protein